MGFTTSNSSTGWTSTATTAGNFTWTFTSFRRPDDGLAGCYARLGVPPGSPPDAIRRAFRAKIKEVHPDLGGSAEEARVLIDAYRRVT